MGPATRRALENRGLAVDLQPERGVSSEDLLAHEALVGIAGTALIVAAPGGRRALERGLAESGWEVRRLDVYQRVPLPVSPEALRRLPESGTGVVSIWTSALALAQVLEEGPGDLADRLREGIFVVISERLAEQARKHGAQRIVVAPGPGNDDIIATLGSLT